MIDGKISIKSLEIFNFSTAIIDAYSQIILDALTAFSGCYWLKVATRQELARLSGINPKRTLLLRYLNKLWK